MRKFITGLVAAVAALGILSGSASAMTYGGIQYLPESPYKYGTIQADAFFSGTATATGTAYVELTRFYNDAHHRVAYKSTLLVRGVKYNFFLKATKSCDTSGIYTTFARFASGLLVFDTPVKITC